MQDVLENEFSKQVTSNHWYKNSDDDTVYLKEKDAKKAFEEKYMKDFSEKNMNILSLICNVAKKHLCMKFTRGTGMGWGRPPWEQSVTKFILANLDFIKDLINSNINYNLSISYKSKFILIFLILIMTFFVFYPSFLISVGSSLHI